MEAVTRKRDVAMDLLRVLACFMVVQIHVGESYYIGPGNTVVHEVGTAWVGWLNSMARCCIALFVMISGYFLLPIKKGQTTGQFLKRRFTRVAIPFVIWCVIYAIFAAARGNTGWDRVLPNILGIFVNYGTEVGHLWYIYMILGLYLLAPVLSPWVSTASKKEMNYVLILWLLSCALCYIHLVFPSVWGECFWNPTPLLYYFTGFGGFFVLGAYIRRFYPVTTKAIRWMAGLLIVVGYLITAFVFHSRLGEEYVPDLELSWGQTSINVAMMGIGIFILVREIKIKSPGLQSVINELGEKSFGIYLVHIIVLQLLFGLLDPLFSSYPAKIFIITIAVFICSYAIIKLLSYIPKSKYLIG